MSKRILNEQILQLFVKCGQFAEGFGRLPRADWVVCYKLFDVCTHRWSASLRPVSRVRPSRLCSLQPAMRRIASFLCNHFISSTLGNRVSRLKFCFQLHSIDFVCTASKQVTIKYQWNWNNLNNLWNSNMPNQFFQFSLIFNLPSHTKTYFLFNNKLLYPLQYSFIIPLSSMVTVSLFFHLLSTVPVSVWVVLASSSLSSPPPSPPLPSPRPTRGTHSERWGEDYSRLGYGRIDETIDYCGWFQP